MEQEDTWQNHLDKWVHVQFMSGLHNWMVQDGILKIRPKTGNLRLWIPEAGRYVAEFEPNKVRTVEMDTIFVWLGE